MKILDRYLIKQFLTVFIFSIIALCSIFIIVNMIEDLGDFLDSNASFGAISDYYLTLLPEILKLLTPVAVLVSILFSVGRLSTNNEIIAMKSGSMSLYRIIAPLGAVCLLLSGWQLYFNGWIVPEANKKNIVLAQRYLHRSKAGIALNNLYFRDNPARNVIIQYYDAMKKTGMNASIEDYTNEFKPRLLRRCEAKQIAWDSIKSAWILKSCTERIFSPDKVTQNYYESMETSLNITHNQILQLQKTPGEMNFSDFHNYIELLKIGGKDVQRLLIEYNGNYAFPFANFIVVLFAAPFAAVRRKGGIAIQIAAAMGVSFFYLVFTKLSQSLGYSAGLSPVIAGWSANIIFLIIGLIVLFRSKT